MYNISTWYNGPTNAKLNEICLEGATSLNYIMIDLD